MYIMAIEQWYNGVNIMEIPEYGQQLYNREQLGRLAFCYISEIMVAINKWEGCTWKIPYIIKINKVSEGHNNN